MRKRQTAVLGFAKTGQAVLDYLLEKGIGEKLFLYNDEPIQDAAMQKKYEGQGVTFWIGADFFPKLAGMSRVILSPGFDGTLPRFAPLRQKGVEVLSEIEFASRLIRAKMIAVTGTNGKSTTVSLIHHLLSRGGRKSVLAGNIGVPFIALVDGIGRDSLVVLEVSSFQLEEIIRFRPHVALLLNLTPDHLDRYPSMEAYTEAKLRLFGNQRHGDFAVVNEDDPALRQYRASLGKGKTYFFSLAHPLFEGAFLEKGEAVLRIGDGEGRVSLARNPLRGVHNLENILAAFLAVGLIGLEPEAMEDGLASFHGLPHRMEWVDTVGGIEFINDSKATNVDATQKSIASIGHSLVVILGGKDKGGDFSVLIEPIRQRVEKVLLIGKAAAAIAAQLSGLADRLVHVTDMRDAVSKGYELLKDRGRGVVLLAPACASFDMFRNFEHRGEVFRQEVGLLKRRVGNG